MRRISRAIVFMLFLIAALWACKSDYMPKPRGYYRIDFPEKQYRTFDSSVYPFVFQMPVYAKISSVNAGETQGTFLNVDFPNYNARIHLTYMDITGNLDLMIEDAFTMAYKHTQKAESIDESVFVNDEKHVYGLLYDIKGNSASSVQFFMTDSVAHYLRGALYFNCQPNKDSLAPAIDFFKQDVVAMIETLRWK